MKIIKLHIKLDKLGGTYEPGEEVKGRVLLNLRKPKSARALKIVVQGDCNVDWRSEESDLDEDEIPSEQSEDFQKSENYINLTNYLVGSKTGDSRIIFPVGKHSYPFSFQLPYEIPSSFEHSYGQVRYTVKAVFERPWTFDRETTKQFNVVSPFDLNTEPMAAHGIEDEYNIPLYWCCCFQNGIMNLQITIPISGYVPGQNINIKLHLRNISNEDIEKIKCTLQQVITVHAHEHDERKAAETILQEEESNGPFRKWDEVTINVLVPPVPPSSLKHCNLIDVEYELKIMIAPSNMSYTMSRIYPIFIGTTPLSCVSSNELVPALSISKESSASSDSESEESSMSSTSESQGRSPPYPLEAGYRPMPVNSQPLPQDYNLGFQNDQPVAGMMLPGDSMTVMPSTIPVPGPSTRQISFVIPSESPPPAYEQCTTGPLQEDQDQDPNTVADLLRYNKLNGSHT